MNLTAILHAALFAVAVAAYVILTETGHDGNPVFLFFAGQVSGLFIQATSKAVDEVAPKSNDNSVQVAPKRSTVE